MLEHRRIVGRGRELVVVVVRRRLGFGRVDHSSREVTVVVAVGEEADEVGIVVVGAVAVARGVGCRP